MLYWAGFIPRPDKNLSSKFLNDSALRQAISQQIYSEQRLYQSEQIDMLVLHHLLFKGQYPCAHSMKLQYSMECRKNNLPSVSNKIIFHNEIRSIQCFMTEEHRQAIDIAAQELWELILQEQEKNRLSSSQIVLMNKLRNLTEYHKIDTFAEIIDHTLTCNLSCILLLNFKKTQKDLYEKLAKKYLPDTIVLISGHQSPKDRQHAIRSFQSNQARIILVMMQAGGIGISLHDITSKYPIVVPISPPLSATHFTQGAGRGYRNGSLSDCLQLLIFAKNTIEEKIYFKQKEKLQCQDILNYGCVNSRTDTIFLSDQPLDSNLHKFSDRYRPQFRHFMNKIAHLVEEN